MTGTILDELPAHLAVDTDSIYATTKSDGKSDGGLCGLFFVSFVIREYNLFLLCVHNLNTCIAASATVPAVVSWCPSQVHLLPLVKRKGGSRSSSLILHLDQVECNRSTDYLTPNIDSFAHGRQGTSSIYSDSSSLGQMECNGSTDYLRQLSTALHIRGTSKYTYSNRYATASL